MRSRTTAAAVLPTVAALLLTACGGSDSQGPQVEPRSPDATAAATSTAAPAGDRINRPEIKLPSDVQDVFEGGTTGDPTEDAVLADNAQRISSITEAITVEAKEHPALRFYSKGDALASAALFVKSFYDRDRSYVGKARYYDREVKLLADGAAQVTYCEDGTQTYPKDRKTGAVDRSIKGSASDYANYVTRLERDGRSVWQTTSVSSTGSAKRCM
ncbi:hypothetical protein [Streptomyces sp. NPDC049915]|uniref:hypothetical protein n=1 Tax=Streptomyces sp. NPDC049915 TaxID=3155510 RepID=UPI0034326A61